MSIEVLEGTSGRLRAVNSILREFSDYRSSTMGRAGGETGWVTSSA